MQIQRKTGVHEIFALGFIACMLWYGHKHCNYLFSVKSSVICVFHTVTLFYVCTNPSELPMPEREGTCYRWQYICPSHEQKITVFQFPENIIITHSWPQSISAQVKPKEERPATLWGQNVLQQRSKRVWEQNMHIAMFTQNAPQDFSDLQVRNLLSQRDHS